MPTPDCGPARPVVLVVEDDPGVREGLGLVLDEHYELLFADDGPPALHEVRTRRVDAVLLDLGLPSMSGFDVLAVLQDVCRTANSRSSLPLALVRLAR